MHWQTNKMVTLYVRSHQFIVITIPSPSVPAPVFPLHHGIVSDDIVSEPADDFPAVTSTLAPATAFTLQCYKHVDQRYISISLQCIKPVKLQHKVTLHITMKEWKICKLDASCQDAKQRYTSTLKVLYRAHFIPLSHRDLEL